MTVVSLTIRLSPSTIPLRMVVEMRKKCDDYVGGHWTAYTFYVCIFDHFDL